MYKIRIFQAFIFLILFSSAFAEQKSAQFTQQTNAVTFNPPKGWRFADSKTLPTNVKMMVIGKGEHEFPPSINLASEDFGGNLAEYLKVIKEINSTQGSIWKDLGKIKLEMGDASLSQADVTTNWGMVRMMHLIFPKDGVIYIMTAAAKKEEFSKYYTEFFDSFKSFKILNRDDEIAENKRKNS